MVTNSTLKVLRQHIMSREGVFLYSLDEDRELDCPKVLIFLIYVPLIFYIRNIRLTKSKDYITQQKWYPKSRIISHQNCTILERLLEIDTSH